MLLDELLTPLRKRAQEPTEPLAPRLALAEPGRPAAPPQRPNQDNRKKLISQLPPNTKKDLTLRVGWGLPDELLTWPYTGGRYWDRTSDLLGVNEALSR